MSNQIDTNDVNLHDILKQRIESGEAIYLTGPATPAINAMIDRLADETGRTVRIVHVIGGQRTMVQSVTPVTCVPGHPKSVLTSGTP